MATTLQAIVSEYLSDTTFQKEHTRLAEDRDASLPALQEVTRRFIYGETDMKTFCKQLEKMLRSDGDWGATGLDFMIELDKFVKYHLSSTNAPEQHFRVLLTGLNANNLGQRIEQCYAFLLDERKRLQQEGKSSGMIVAVNRSAFIISLFAFWLDPDNEPLVYYDTVRKGLFKLIKENVVSKPSILSLGADAVEVRRASDHATCITIISQIAERDSSVKTSRYWAEDFCLWVTQSFQPNLELLFSGTTLIKDQDTDVKADILSKAPTKQTIVYDKGEPYLNTGAFEQKSENTRVPTLANESLHAVSEALLVRLIREVQRRILVDERTIRRIYYALLAGHVILTGPPGTGKTDLARTIPETLWRSMAEVTQHDADAASDESDEPDLSTFKTETAYTTRLVTANDDWSVRTLISGIVPQHENGMVIYKMQYGYLTSTILKNWHFQGHAPAEWSMVTLNRTSVTKSSSVERGLPRTFRGQWLVIDEFNRAPIDLALGDALTALSGNSDEALRVPIEGGTAELPIPKDFRILGTLNSFDRSYLNQLSEALKRRFSFIEVLPPTRAMRESEQKIVLYKALSQVSHLIDTIDVQNSTVYWLGEVEISHDATELFSLMWDDDERYAFHAAFEAAWRVFEVIRIYRQLGTAQAISLYKQMLIPGILQGHATLADWLNALDYALCDSIADQLQVLLPDEIETLLLYFTTAPDNFSDAYHRQLVALTSRPQRLYGQLLAFNSVSDEQGQPLLSDAEVEHIAAQSIPMLDKALLSNLFHLEQPHVALPHFTRRLRTFKTERGL